MSLPAQEPKEVADRRAKPGHDGMRRPWKLVAAAALVVLGGCAVGPNYERPSAPVPTTYKELKGWKRAAPADTLDRGPWWAAFHDPVLGRLEERVNVGNQNLKAAVAAYDQARALVHETQAGLFPVVAGNGAIQRQRSRGLIATTATVEGTASWDLDLWGRIRRQVESQAAVAQASAADLANARLSAQAELATLYFELRYQDALERLLADTVSAFRRSLQITKNQYAAGVVGQSDVITAQTQLDGAQAELIDAGIARAKFEHAIAVLVGVPPAALSLARGRLGARLPRTPAGVPSTLLERRPDIAAAERTMQAQNALIGAQLAAFFPDVNLSAALGAAGPLPLFTASNALWTLAASGAETLFEGGARTAAVAAASAAYRESVANYRQTVLTAFQEVEDQLATLRILSRESAVRERAARDARQAVQIALNEYQAGTTAYTTVVQAQATALSAEQSALAVQENRYVAAVSLIQALGGGWSTARLPAMKSLRKPSLSLPGLRGSL
jgi:NodT family efflux transporter outer membrane factor (OMF) lipoprotein